MENTVKEHRVRLPRSTVSVSVEPAGEEGYATVVIRYRTAERAEERPRPRLRLVQGGALPEPCPA